MHVFVAIRAEHTRTHSDAIKPAMLAVLDGVKCFLGNFSSQQFSIGTALSLPIFTFMKYLRSNILVSSPNWGANGYAKIAPFCFATASSGGVLPAQGIGSRVSSRQQQWRQ